MKLLSDLLFLITLVTRCHPKAFLRCCLLHYNIIIKSIQFSYNIYFFTSYTHLQCDNVDQVSVSVKLPSIKAFHCQANVKVMGGMVEIVL